ncbi:non-ribosomal peptide synthetase [Spirosoma utsteinense]|uniref:Amino acid adenylation domain-containing protein n=1 Tax=Spirosoma utsteinense TaxID=2585773 RepID=A0ABR6W8E2_9BACT|nr:non-ribosomal peptide synthetase [Spirosoma utsteinense]MBC3787162.1 amino acid adenylation domain-containing protein [Spirosoma utsteinense]MBC3792845.1 amino acid adenylation domain-containing protein [Spirosoma utsteinense]
MNTLVGYRISPQQRHALSVYNRASTLNSQIVLQCNSNSDTTRLYQTITDVFGDEQIAKTTYYQVEEPSSALQMPGSHTRIEFSTYEGTFADDTQLNNWIDTERHRGFDLINGPIVRVTTVTRPAEDRLIVIGLPSIAADLHTLHVISKRITEQYEAGAAPDAEEKLSYLQFAEWQNQLLEDEDNADSVAYWRNKQASGFRKTLLFDKDANNGKEYAPAKVTLELNKVFVGQANGATAAYTPDVYVYAAWNLLLWRLLKQENFVSGYVHAFREYEELQSLCGFCSKTLPTCLNWDPQWQVRDLLEATRQEIDVISTHKDVFLEETFFSRYPDAGSSYTIPYSFEYVDLQANTAPSASAIKVVNHLCFSENAKLKLVCRQLTDGLGMEWQYNASCFSPEDIAFLADALNVILTQVLQNPEAAITDVNLLSPNYANRLVHDFNRTDQSLSPVKTVGQLFARCVDQYPNQGAVVAGNVRLTYQQLDRQATAIACYITQTHAIKKGDLVGVMCGKNEKLTAALLGVIKSGAGFVPIDPANPADRVNFILQDSGVKLLLTDNAYAVMAGTVPVIGIDQISSATGADVYLEERTPESVLYVIYTSGTTGKPKGTIIQDQALLNYVAWFTRAFGINSLDSSILLGSYAFDLGYTSLWGTLLNGAELHLVDDELVKNPDSVIHYLTENSISFVKATPSLFHTLVASDSVQGLAASNLRLVLLGGEPINVRDLNVIAAVKPAITLVNHYGPTESTIGTIACPVNSSTASLEAYAHLPVIGYPVTNNRIYIVNEAGQLVPPGIEGELMVAGAGLARGYLNRDELTQEKFIADPFHPGQSMYQTGDIASWLPNGTILFKGRRDEQVKIRGYRVETDEVQKVMLGLSGIKEALVVPRPSDEYGLELAAYFLAANQPDPADLRESLLQVLPDYMVPSYYVQLDKFPLTPNGKVDKKALPDPGLSQANNRQVAPRTALEKKLTGIWSDVLEKNSIGVEDDFFTLGGHSLKAIKLVTQLSKVLGVKIALQDVFIHSTIEKLARHLQQKGVSVFEPIPVLENRSYYDLSHAQHRLWILHQMEDNQTAYNVPAVFTMQGHLNTDAFNRAFETVTNRHESLRTSFITVDGEPKQFTHQPGQIALGVGYIDLRTEPDQAQKAAAYVNQEVNTVFDLEKAPLVRAHLLQLADDRFIFLFNIHHIISDEWSLGILINEILTCYDAYQTGLEVPLQPLRIQYKDFAAWQNQKLTGTDVEQARTYWLTTFGDEIPVLNFPADYPRPAVQTFSGNRISTVLGKDVSDQLGRFNQQQSVTMYMTLLASVTGLLHHYTDQEDMVIGTPMAGRDHPDLDGQIGFFVNTLPIRTRFKRADSFATLVQTTRTHVLQAQAHQAYPFDRLVGDLNLDRDLSRSALFDVMVSLSNPESAVSKLRALKDLDIAEYTYPHTISKFDLSFDFQETEKGLQVGVEYNTDLYEASRVEKLLDHYARLLAVMLDNPDQELQQYSMLSEEEVNQLLNDFNPADQPDVYTTSVVHAFDDQVRQTPFATAVVFEGERLTYQELNEQANQLAAYLQRTNPDNADRRIGLMMGRSLDMVISVLAVLKSGASYVPVDADYPVDRIEFLLRDSGIEVLLTDGAGSPAVIPGFVKVVNLATIAPEVNAYPVSNVANTIDPANLAYTIYTSGSTGTPKGVAVTHQSLMSIAMAWRSSYKLDSFTPRLLQMASLSFDVFMGDFCRSLLNGGALIICPAEVRLQPDRLCDLIVEHQINILETTPAIILPLMDYVYDNQQDISFMELLIMGSDTCLATDFARLVERFGGHMRILNSYGTTETTIDSSYYEEELDRIPHYGATPIGKPLPNTRYYILNESRKLVPVGVNGELYIGGAGVAKEYLNREALTAERFIKIPELSSGAIYKTGDKACWLPDGNVEFLGRNDSQIKIRGYRIEPSEVESTLLLLEMIKAAAVVVHTDSNKENRLIAYCVLHEGSSIAGVKDALSGKLPAYMVPSAFKALDCLPLTVNGKVNYKALASLTLEDALQATDYVAPSNVVEQTIAAIWQEILSRSSVGANDHFFEIGGHSLKATQVISQIHKRLNIDVPLRLIFTHPVLSELAREISIVGKTAFEGIKNVAPAEHYPLSYAQKRLWLQHQIGEGQAAYTIKDAYLFEGVLNREAMSIAFHQLIERHESLRTVFAIQDGEPRQFIKKTEEVGFHITYNDLRSDAHRWDHVTELAENWVKTPFELDSGPLLRALLIQPEQNQYVFVLTMHHIISDGWSSGVLIKEILALYNAHVNQKPNSLPPLKLQYKDFAAWHNDVLDGEKLRQLQTYWKERLSGELTPVNLLTDRPRPLVKSYRGSTCRVDVAPSLAEKLHQVSRQEGGSLYMVLLSIVNVLLHKYTGQEDVCIGTPVSGRVHADLDSQIGFYVNSIPIRTYPKAGQTFRTYVSEVKETVLAAYQHQLYPFERIVEDLKLEYDRSRSPVTDIWMHLFTNDLAQESAAIAGLAIREFGLEHAFSKHDLTFNFMDTSGQISLIINYSTDLFNVSTIETMMDDFVKLAETVAVEPNIRLADVSLHEELSEDQAFLESMFNL